MAETFIFVFEGGPQDGQQHLPKRGEKFTWPLPDEIQAIDHRGVKDLTGKYVKFWESKGDAVKSGEARGAKYRWESNEEVDLTGLL